MSLSYASRTDQIDFAAHAGQMWQMDGPAARRLMRLCARYRNRLDRGDALEQLKEAIRLAAPEGVPVDFSATQVWIGGTVVP